MGGAGTRGQRVLAVSTAGMDAGGMAAGAKGKRCSGQTSLCYCWLYLVLRSDPLSRQVLLEGSLSRQRMFGL
jgi:hypothetical protein